MRSALVLQHWSRHVILGALVATVGQTETGLAEEPSPTQEFRTVVRRRGVDLEKEYDLTGLSVPLEQVHRLVPKDGIPALTDPKTEPATASEEWLWPTTRLIVVTVGDEVLAVPLPLIDKHEVVNATIGGQPVAITYCPLCDSAAVFSRRVRSAGGDDGSADEAVLEFGVSGALYNSNVLLYDRTDLALWSQLGMKAVSGPRVGTRLDALPLAMLTYEQLLEQHPEAKVTSRETGHRRKYKQLGYKNYFSSNKLIVPVWGVGDALPRKTLGAGVVAGEKAYFVPQSALSDAGYTLATPLGDVKLARSAGGIVVDSKPDGVQALQTFYYSWSAFYPETEVVSGR